MPGRTWLKLVRNSFGAGAVLAAAQVGVGSGLGILDWPLSFTAMRGWGQLLTWVAFIFAVGVAGGSVIGRRALRRPRPTITLAGRIVAAASAGLGAVAAFPLVWIPVRVNQPTVDLTAEVTASVTAGIAIAVGILLGIAALSWKPVAVAISTSAAWVWLFAFASVALAARDHVRVNPRLGLLDAPQLIPPEAWWFGPYLMVGVAALCGFAVAAAAGWRGTSWLGITASGLAGPGLVAAAYLITGWGVSGNGEDAAPYVAAVLAVLAGTLAAMAVASATIPHRPAPRIMVSRPVTNRPALATQPAPLAITAYVEPAYVLESSTVEPPYRREPAFYSEKIYLPGPRPQLERAPAARPSPTTRPDLNRRPEPAAEASYEPPYEAPYEPPYDPNTPPNPAPKTKTPRFARKSKAGVESTVDATTGSTPGPATSTSAAASSAPAASTSAAASSAQPSYEVASGYEPGHAVPIEAVVVLPAGSAPGAVVEDAILVDEPVRAPAAAAAAGAPAPAPVRAGPSVSHPVGTSVAEPVSASLAEPSATGTPSAATPMTATSVTATPSTATPAAEQSTAVEQGAEPGGPSAPGPEVAAEPVDSGRKGRDKDKDRRPLGRRARRQGAEGKGRLRDVERDHIDWIDNLVKLPADPTLKMSKER